MRRFYLLRWPDILAQVFFTPLLAAWSIWLGLGISARTLVLLDGLGWRITSATFNRERLITGTR